MAFAKSAVKNWLLIGVSVAFVAGLATVDSAPKNPSSETVDDLDLVMKKAAESLRASIKADGRFAYSVNVQTGEEAKAYNMLRHSGSVWVLGEYALAHGDESLTDAVTKANGFMLRETLRPLAGTASLRAVISDPAIDRGDRPKRAVLGGSALAVLALLAQEKLKPGSVPRDALRALESFLLFMQKPNGGFYAVYLMDRKARSDEYASLYFPGEALLALATLAEQDQGEGREKKLAAVRRGLDHLAEEQDPVVPAADDWALQAIESYLVLVPNESAARREAYERFTRRVTEAQMAEQVSQAASIDDVGCYLPGGRVNATAARLEGMLAALKVLRPEAALRNFTYRHSLALALDCVRRGQAESGGIRSQLPSLFENRPESNEIRIDNTQHALGAMLRYRAAGLPVFASSVPFTKNHIRAVAWETFRPVGQMRRSTGFDGFQGRLAKMDRVDHTGSSYFRPQLRGADIIETKLRGADFALGDGAGMRLISSDLRNATFRAMNLAGADFSFSDLRGARFESCDLSGVSFAAADLRGATYDENTILPFGRDQAEKRGLQFQSSRNP